MSQSRTLAALDLGSNSFHVTLATFADGNVRWQEAMSEKVQLAAGLDAKGNLDQAAQERGLACLARFAERISGVEKENVRVVATSTLRQAHNAHEFVQAAEALLGCRVEVISGVEEARLINLGVAHALSDNSPQRLVVDIGGGSTELIIGKDMRALETRSLVMGCVVFTRRFFADGLLTERNYDAAYLAACQQLQPVKQFYLERGWQYCVGASGTVKAVARACGHKRPDAITPQGIETLKQRLLKTSRLDALTIRGVPANRCHIIPAGLAILQAVMDELGVESVEHVSGALREGVVHQMVDERQGDVHPADDSLAQLAKRCRIDARQAQRVSAVARQLYQQQNSRLASSYHERLMQAAAVHEAGMIISYEQHQKHGGYLVQHADMAGFSRRQQKQLASLVRGQRGRLPAVLLEQSDAGWLEMAVILRLAVLVNHARVDRDCSGLLLQKTASEKWEVHVPSVWQTQRPLFCADLVREVEWLDKAGIRLAVMFR